jgi:hypothetical protein
MTTHPLATYLADCRSRSVIECKKPGNYSMQPPFGGFPAGWERPN